MSEKKIDQDQIDEVDDEFYFAHKIHTVSVDEKYEINNPQNIRNCLCVSNKYGFVIVANKETVILYNSSDLEKAQRENMIKVRAKGEDPEPKKVTNKTLTVAGDDVKILQLILLPSEKNFLVVLLNDIILYDLKSFKNTKELKRINFAGEIIDVKVSKNYFMVLFKEKNAQILLLRIDCKTLKQEELYEGNISAFGFCDDSIIVGTIDGKLIIIDKNKSATVIKIPKNLYDENGDSPSLQILKLSWIEQNFIIFSTKGEDVWYNYALRITDDTYEFRDIYPIELKCPIIIKRLEKTKILVYSNKYDLEILILDSDKPPAISNKDKFQFCNPVLNRSVEKPIIGFDFDLTSDKQGTVLYKSVLRNSENKEEKNITNFPPSPIIYIYDGQYITGYHILCKADLNKTKSSIIEIKN